MLKKFFILTLLISSLSLSAYAKQNYSYTINQTPIQTQYNTQGAYVNEEITTPISQIGVPENYLQPQVEEKWLEIEWNEWHARVRNYIKKNKYSKLATEERVSKAWHSEMYSCVFFLVYTVHANGKITDVMLINFKEHYDFEKDAKYNITIVKNGKTKFKPEFEVCMRQPNGGGFKNYTYALNQDTVITSKPILNIFNNATFVKEASLLDSIYCTNSNKRKIAKTIEKLNDREILKFPEKSKRNKVIVTQGYTHYNSLEGFSNGNYKSSNFNDIERIK